MVRELKSQQGDIAAQLTVTNFSEVVVLQGRPTHIEECLPGGSETEGVSNSRHGTNLHNHFFRIIFIDIILIRYFLLFLNTDCAALIEASVSHII